MCNMAAYAGSEQAAPILLQMLEAQEGIGGGHFSGIATLHEGKIHLAKVCGDFSRLREETDAASLPGTIGIAHSRTPGVIPEASWAQPFFSYDGDIALCANGAPGRFRCGENSQKTYDFMKTEGAIFPSEIDWHIESYPNLDNGHSLHSSELFSSLVAFHNKEEKLLRRALKKAFEVSPSEIAALALSEKEPNAVSAFRLNQPLMWGHKNSAFYLATSALAFIEQDLNWINPAPTAATMTMTAESIEFIPMKTFSDFFVAKAPVAAIYKALDRLLADGKAHPIGDFTKAIKVLWPEDKLAEAAMYSYEYIREKFLAGEIIQVKSSADASRKGDKAPVVMFQKTDA